MRGIAAAVAAIVFSGLVFADDPRDTGRPEEMDRLLFLVGQWTAQPSFIDFEASTGSWAETRAYETKFDARYDGAFIVGEMDVLFPGEQTGWRSFMVISFDRFQDVYRIGVFDDQWALADIYEGQWESDSLVATNRETGTWGPGGPNGEMIPASFRLTPSQDRRQFTFEWISSIYADSERPVIRIDHQRIGE